MPANRYQTGGQDYFADTGSAAASPPASGNESGQVAPVPASICPGMEPGDEFVVRVERVVDGQYLVSYSNEPVGETPERQEPPAEPVEEPTAEAMMGL